MKGYVGKSPVGNGSDQAQFNSFKVHIFQHDHRGQRRPGRALSATGHQLGFLRCIFVISIGCSSK